MNAYTYGIQNFLHTSIAFNIQLFSDEYGNKEEAQGNTSGFYYYDIYKETDENNQEYWDVDGSFGLSPEQYTAIIDTEGIFPTQIPIALIRLNGELLETYFPDLAGTDLPVYEIEPGRFVIKTDRVIPLDATSILGFTNKRKKRKVTRASNQLGETGAFVTIFVSSDGAKLERAYQQITEFDTRELVLFVETKDKNDILGTVMRIKTGSGIGVSEQGIPFAEIIKIPSFLNFNVEEGLLRKIIKRHFHNLRDGEENVFYIILKKSLELIEIPAGYSLKFSILALNKLIDGATETFRLDEKRWNDKHPDYTPLIPLPINGKVDFSIARKEFQDSMDGLATGLAILNRTMIVAPFLRPLLEPKLKTLNRAFTKELPKLLDTLLEEAGENILNAHHFYNSLLVGILNSIIDLAIGIFQLISLLLQVYEAELGAAKQLTENPSSFLSIWIEMLENGLEIFTNLLTKENLAALLLFQQKMMVKIAKAGLEALKDPNGIEIPYSHIGYYSGFIVGFIIEEILIALATGGAGNIAQATNLAMQSFSQTLKGARKFVKKGAMEMANTMENFLELFSQLRKHSKNLKKLLNDLDKQIDELIRVIKKDSKEIDNLIKLGKTGSGGFVKYKEILSRNMVRQEEPMSCAAASIKQLAKDIGKTISETKIRKLAKTTERGTDNKGIYNGMKKVFEDSEIFAKGYLNNLDDKLNFKEMIIDMGDSKFITNLGLPPKRHNIIVDKIIGKDVYIRDPWPLEGYDFSKKIWKGDNGVEGIIDLDYFIQEWAKGGNVAFKII